MNGSATLLLKLRDVLETAETRLRTTSGISHDEVLVSGGCGIR